MYGQLVFKVVHQLSVRLNHFVEGSQKDLNKRIHSGNLHHWARLDQVVYQSRWVYFAHRQIFVQKAREDRNAGEGCWREALAQDHTRPQG